MNAVGNDIVLEMKGISKHFGGVVALENVDFDLRRGEVQGLVGVNGAGKSTLMKILAGAHADYAGEVRVNGEPAHFQNPRIALDHGVGLVYQELSVIDCLSVAENIVLEDYPMKSGGIIDWDAANKEARDHLAQFGFGDIRVSRELGSYDFALKQIVEIIKVLRTGAKIIILDEPTSGVSREEIDKLFAMIRRLKALGTSIIFISHHLDDVLEISDRITILRDGKLVDVVDAEGCTKRILVEKMLGKRGAGLAKQSSDFSIDLPSREDLDRLPECLEVDRLSVSGAFKDVSFKVRYGEILGLHGLVGSGYADVGRCLFGLYPKHTGKVVLEGEAIKAKTPHRSKNHGIAFLSDDRSKTLVYSQTIYCNTTLTVLKDLFKKYIFGFVLRKNVEIEITQRHMADLMVKADSPETIVGALSGGNIQKVCLSKWLTFLPKLMILTEPTKGIDVQAKAELAQYIKKLKEKGNVAVIVISMEPETIMDMCDRVLVFSKGKVVKEFCGCAISEPILLEAS